MERAFDKTSVIKTLRDGIKKGYWTLEDLDKPSSGSMITRDIYGRTPAGNVSALRLQTIPAHKNLLRQASPEVAVEVIDPKDFLPQPKNEPSSETSHSNEPY